MTARVDRERVVAARALVGHAVAGRVGWGDVALAVLVLLDKALEDVEEGAATSSG